MRDYAHSMERMVTVQEQMCKTTKEGLPQTGICLYHRLVLLKRVQELAKQLVGHQAHAHTKRRLMQSSTMGRIQWPVVARRINAIPSRHFRPCPKWHQSLQGRSADRRLSTPIRPSCLSLYHPEPDTAIRHQCLTNHPMRHLIHDLRWLKAHRQVPNCRTRSTDCRRLLLVPCFRFLRV